MWISTQITNSSFSMARSIRRPFGAVRTGLPATVTSALIWPSPAVSISSAITETGNSPLYKGWPDTRERASG